MAFGRQFGLEDDEEQTSPAVRIWLYGVILLVFVMVLVGGATRLTDSGLSITEWKPIMGAIPPLSEADWQDAFAKYKQIPEYAQVNAGMSLPEFKSIFWWEWGHRFLGRFIGVVFLLPLLFFWLTGRLHHSLKLPLAGLFVLGGLQGGMGWYMVKSGLVDRIDVSQYRLAAHLGFALLIMGLMFWIAQGLRPSRREFIMVLPVEKRHVLAGAGLVGLVFVQFLLGALVAGLDAGKIYNSWPLMEGRLVPEGLFETVPWYLNLFENRLTVQFDHRLMAYFLFGVTLFYAILVSRITDGILQRGAWIVFGLLCFQIGWGIFTLLMVAPFYPSLIHQALGMLVFLAVIWHVHMMYEAYRTGQA